MTDLYNVVVNGSVIPGWKNQEVVNNLAIVFKMSHEKAERLLSGKPYTVKKKADHATAKKLLHIIENAGAECEIVKAETDTLNFQFEEKAKGTEISCPKCGHRQPERNECIQCGIVFSKFKVENNSISHNISEDSLASEESSFQSDLSFFIGKRTQKYLNKFEIFQQKQDSYAFTWNWAAFFLTTWWFAYRKLYLWTLISILVSVLFSMFLPLLSLFFYITIGASANFIYYRYSKNKIKELRARYPQKNINNKLSMAGGTSFKVPAILGGIVLLGIVSAVAFPVFDNYRTNATFAKMDSRAILRPKFYCAEGVYKAGTAFVVTIPESRRDMMLTAHHLFSPAGGFKREYNWDEITSLVQKVKATSINDLYSWIETTEVLPIEGGHSFDGNSACYDLAVFPLVNEYKVPVLSLATKLPRRFENVWLFAEVLNKDSDKMLYQARVAHVDERSITYIFEDPTLDLTATSGAPVLNRNGEVVALNLGGGEQNGSLLGVGNPAAKIREMILKSSKKYL